MVSHLVSAIWYDASVPDDMLTKEEAVMNKLNQIWVHYATPQNRKVVYILVTLAALAIAGGAPGAGSGMG